ncbi:hypothetical protein L596_002251 [Steinernema carpocapsae]|uniref:UBX domain-containing protein n=1 Tax=Steinernema carpocapsae TaxID=34508 RepID=A0A4U8UP16_STECR|nr:hypothetical protein L596_002251 [Steinernema carpocapsae]
MGGLDQRQREILRQFMELTNIADDDYATAVLASLDWDIEKAFDEFQSQIIDDDPGYLQSSINVHGESLGLNDDSLRNSPSSGYSSRPSGSKLTLASNGIDSGSGSSSSLMVAGGDLPSTQISKTETTLRPTESAAFEFASDDDQDDAEYYEYDDDEEPELQSLEQESSSSSSFKRDSDRPALMPTNWDSEEDAVANFTEVFEARYGGIHPYFHIGSLRDAMREAFECADTQERRPLAIYVHDDNAIACNIFAGKVLSSQAVSDLLGGQYVTWPWDVTQTENKEKLLGWLQELNMFEAQQVVRTTLSDSYPMLLVVTASKNQYQLVAYSTGHEYINDVTDKLIQGLSEYMDIKTNERKEELERMEREQIRREQQEEYEKALAADRARQEEEERERQLQLEAEEEGQRKMEQKKRRLEELLESVPEEPAATESGIITFRIRFPGGEAKIRRFRQEEALDSLINFVQGHGFFMENNRIWNSNVPKQDISTFDLSKSFADLKFPAREQVIVEEK